jgi:Sulfotransferase family
LESWVDQQAALERVAKSQLFFIGGAPRSGTTWLTHLLNAHPDICCGGEALFNKHLAEPMQKLVVEWRKAVEAKNNNLFRETGGFPLPDAEDEDLLIGTAILKSLTRIAGGRSWKAIGEKTPENVFFFPRLKRIFPAAKLVSIARDPRDVLTSGWHFFYKEKPGEDINAAKIAFIRLAAPSMNKGARAVLTLVEQHPKDCIMVTYERMRADPAPAAQQLFQFLGVSHDKKVVDEAVAKTSFAAMSGGRQAGTTQNGSFFRKGVVGDWHSTLTPEMNDIIMREMGWMFPHFGWKP